MEDVYPEQAGPSNSLRGRALPACGVGWCELADGHAVGHHLGAFWSIDGVGGLSRSLDDGAHGVFVGLDGEGTYTAAEALNLAGNLERLAAQVRRLAESIA